MTVTPTDPILLVHGAYHGAWCWKPVIPHLERLGRQAVAIDLPGAGDDPADPGTVTFADYVARVIESARGLGRPAVLVGHSMGGMSITQAAEEAPELFRAVVYLTAMLPRDGDTAGGLLAPDERAPDFGPLMSGNVLNVLPPDMARDTFYHDCPEPLVADALSRLRPIPLALLASPVRLTGRAASLPHHYIECLDDRALTLVQQRQLIAGAPLTIHTLDSAHSPFLSMPEQLAGVLATI